jgi:hypothetical protein
VIEFLSFRDAHTVAMSGEKQTEEQVARQWINCGPSGEWLRDFGWRPRWAECRGKPLRRDADGEGGFRNGPRPHGLNVRLTGAVRSQRGIRLESKSAAAGTGGAWRVAAAGSPTRPRTRAQRSRTSEQFKHQYLLPRPGLDEDLAAVAVCPTPMGQAER